MTDKVLENVEAVLAGKRMKFLDPTRKAVLALPNAAFKVWMAYWMHESDGQEAYPEMETLVVETGVSESTIRRSRDYLVKLGWLVRLEGSAGSRYTKASNGSWNIGVYRVNDPTSVKMTEVEGESVKMTDHVNFTLVSILTPNGALAFAPASTGTIPVTDRITTTTAPTETSYDHLTSGHDSLREERPEEQPQEQKQRPGSPVTGEPEPSDPDEEIAPHSAPPPITTIECGKCSFQFPYNQKGMDALDLHLFQIHHIKPL